MKTKININTRFDTFQKYSLYLSLDNKSQNEIKAIGIEYKLTFKEMKQLTYMVVDFKMRDVPAIGIQRKEYFQSMNQSTKMLNKPVLTSLQNH